MKTELPGVNKAFLVGIDLAGAPHGLGVEESLDELSSLVDTAGVEVVGQVSQRLASVHPDTYIGSGKLAEIKAWVDELGADLVVFDDELSPRHQRELEKIFGRDVRVIDRTALILDIFAQHARSREGALQVSLAQYEYRLPRLTRLWSHLARQAGGSSMGRGAAGVGLRGPGETQLETDRREIRRHIRHLRQELAKVRRQRNQQRVRRHRHGIPQIVLVGYTNAGKSTLLNALSGSVVYVADKLFATLDPTTRRLVLPDGHAVLVTDTVGFIQKLPHQLVAAFRATLEEVVYADVLIHVVDASHPQALEHIEIVEAFLETLIGETRPPMLMALNKIDAVDSLDDGALEAIRSRYPDGVCMSSLTGEGMDQLVSQMQTVTNTDVQDVKLHIPYEDYDLVSRFYEVAVGVTQMNGDNGVELRGSVRSGDLVRFESFRVRQA